MEIKINSEEKRREAVGYIAMLDLNNSYNFKVTKVTKKRTLSQNAALHLLFKQIALNLNKLGIPFSYTGLKGLKMETPYNERLVKDTIWRPIQLTLYDIESTKDLDTLKINEILDILVRFFAERGIEINFPSQIDLIAKKFMESGYY